MSTPASIVIAEFAGADALGDAARRARSGGFQPVDALTPCLVEGLDETLGIDPSPIRRPMLIGALAVGAALYSLEAWSAVFAYPFDSGGRPLLSWQVFLLAPIEVGALAAALAGFIALLFLCGLPRLNHPVFDWDPIERAGVDRYFLLLAEPSEPSEFERLRSLLGDAGTLSVGRTPS